jgi:ribonuclease P/MRP protein subunit RPP40
MQLDLILPEEVYELVRARLEDVDSPAFGRGQYARVYMKLEEVLAGDFFKQYVKMGNIMMRSEGRANVDNIFTLYEGVLRLDLDRPTYERCGLQGQPREDGGRKHQKARWGMSLSQRRYLRACSGSCEGIRKQSC